MVLFFGASILPDPDFPYEPTAVQCHTWITAVVFETAFVVCGFLREKDSSHACGIAYALLALHVCRITCFSTAIVLYLAPQHQAYSSVAYGATEPSNVPDVAQKDAQTTGWIDYLVGFGTFWPFIWPSHSFALQCRAYICIFLLILQRIVNILVPVQLGRLVAALGHGHMPWNELLLYTLFRTLQGQQGVIASIRALLWIPIGQAAYRRLTESAFEHVLSLSLEFHLGKRLGEVMSALNKGAAINTFLDALIFQMFPMIADIGVAAAYLLLNFNPMYSLIIIAMGGIYLFVTIYMAKYRGRARRRMVNEDREMEARRTDAIMSYEVVHYNDAVRAELSRFSSRITTFQSAEYSVLVSLNLLNTNQNLVFAAGVMLVICLSAYDVSIGVQKVATFVTLLSYLTQLQAPLAFFGSFYTMIQNNLIDAERMLALFHEQPTVVDSPEATEMVSCRGHIAFRNVSFAYDARKPALQDITFEAKPGTSVAIVGESGSGKSTLLRLLFRFYNPSAGVIAVDGRDVRDTTIQSLRSHFGVVPQETMLFNDSLMYNIRYSKPTATDDEVYAACAAASIHDKILAFPDGYNTQVGERGLRLSGGEKQRIAIARAILKNPDIVLMDEATASLDSETEKTIQASLAKVSEGRTTITIAHRLSTIVNSDEIIVLHQGRIIERGNHAQLLALGGRYKEMWGKQTEVVQS
ncbi:putative transport protein [Macrophomina phaseolina]|uniref:Transport protein n=1 Tax=Macrophomina phaseolina TaxID=35725 RepID=A0ABQ8G992_9PEZI|nr:putative transport protein [Macrophomina phaseolina]